MYCMCSTMIKSENTFYSFINAHDIVKETQKRAVASSLCIINKLCIYTQELNYRFLKNIKGKKMQGGYHQ